MNIGEEVDYKNIRLVNVRSGSSCEGCYFLCDDECSCPVTMGKCFDYNELGVKEYIIFKNKGDIDG